MRILITHPEFSDPGGVAGYWKQLHGLFAASTVHFTVGRRTTEKGLFSKIARLLTDYWSFTRTIRTTNVDLVHLNPSLDPKSFVRDGIFALLARINHKKTIVFFHGWQAPFETRIDRGLVWVFKLLFGKSDAFIVLSSQFRRTLKRWGVSKPIYLEVTLINPEALEGFVISDVVKKRVHCAKKSVLFLSRIVADKGIYETVDAVSLIQGKHPEVELVIAGDGKDAENIRAYVSSRNIPNVKFVGYIRGAEKRRVLEDSYLFCFPSRYGEGLPTCVVEAMAFGLPVITRPVGGIADFFEDGKHGFISESLDPAVFADMIDRLLLDKGLYKRISMANYRHAQAYFLASNAASRLERAYEAALEQGAADVAEPWDRSAESARPVVEEVQQTAPTGPRILIAHPEFADPGGVARYWRTLDGEFTMSTVHFTVGKRTAEKGTLSRIRRLASDYWRFVRHLRKDNIDLVHLNPSLDPKSFTRDGIFALLAGAWGKKTVASFHGWQKPFERRLSRGFSWVFRFFFGKTEAFIVLSDAFKKTIESWGVTKPVYREVSVNGKDSHEGFDIHEALRKRHKAKKWRILFLSRILKTKGIYETVQAAAILGKKHPNLELVVAGNGPELDKVRSFARDIGAANVVFSGYVRGEEKRRLFEDSHMFCLPSYSEGFPVAIVEAMAFGLPVITRPVGGLIDFFKDGEHGFMSDSLDPNVLADCIERLFLDRKLYDRIAISNHRYAQGHFLASDAAWRLERIYKTLLNSSCVMHDG